MNYEALFELSREIGATASSLKLILCELICKDNMYISNNYYKNELERNSYKLEALSKEFIKVKNK